MATNSIAAAATISARLRMRRTRAIERTSASSRASTAADTLRERSSAATARSADVNDSPSGRSSSTFLLPDACRRTERRQLGYEQRACAMQPRSNRANRTLHDPGSRLIAHLLELAERDDFAIRRRQRGDRGANGRNRLGARQTVEHVRLLHGDRVQLPVDIPGQSLVISRSKSLQHKMPRDPEKIVANGSARRVVLVRAAQYRQERLLHYIVGGVGSAHMRRVSEDRAFMTGKQR